MSRKYQYEYALKKWKMRKNIKRQDWVHAHHNIKQIQEQGKRSHLLLNDIPVPEGRSRRAFQRYGPDVSLAHKYGLGTFIIKYLYPAIAKIPWQLVVLKSRSIILSG